MHTSCSHPNLIGSQFNRWTVLAWSTQSRGSTFKRKICCICACKCGNIREVGLHQLSSGKSKSCGCYARERTSQVRSLPPGEASKNATISDYRKHARKRGLVWSLSKSECERIFASNCFYCGKPPSNYARNNGSATAFVYTGIDRIDNTQGYLVENVLPSCFVCNDGKKAKTYDEFLNWIHNIADRHPRPSHLPEPSIN